MPKHDAFKTIDSLKHICASRKFDPSSEENFMVLSDAVEHLRIGLDVNKHLNFCLDNSEAEIYRLHSELATIERCRDEKYSMACSERDAMAKRLVKAEKELAQMKAERDALVDILKKLDCCEYCKHDGTEYPDFEICVEGVACSTCERSKIPCCSCIGGSNWEWKGLGKKEEM